MITKNKYNDEINTFLNEKVLALQTFLQNYYNQIYSKFNTFYYYLEGDINSIYYNLNEISICTRAILNSEYVKIYNKTKPIDYKYSNYIEKYNKPIEHEQNADHMTIKGNASIYNIKEYAEFKLDIILEGRYFIRPKVKGRIVDKSIPERVELNIYSDCGKCCKEGYLYNITMNDSNYTMTVEYDTKTNNINITTYTNIEKYNITEIMYSFKQKEKNITENFDNKIFVNFTVCLKDYTNYTINYANSYEEPAKNFNNSMIIIK